MHSVLRMKKKFYAKALSCCCMCLTSWHIKSPFMVVVSILPYRGCFFYCPFFTDLYIIATRFIILLRFVLQRNIADNRICVRKNDRSCVRFSLRVTFSRTGRRKFQPSDTDSVHRWDVRSRFKLVPKLFTAVTFERVKTDVCRLQAHCDI